MAAYRDRLSFGLVAFGHRKASNCADSEIVAKPGALTAETQDKLLEKIKPKGQAPIAAALANAAKGATAKDPLDIVLIADGGDTCDADICSAALAMKEKSPALRIHVIGFGDKEEELKPLSCLAGATGGTFLAAANAEGLKGGLAKVFDAVLGPQPAPAQTAAAGEDGIAPAATSALPAGVVAMQPIDLSAGPQPAGRPGRAAATRASARASARAAKRRRDGRAQIAIASPNCRASSHPAHRRDPLRPRRTEAVRAIDDRASPAPGSRHLQGSRLRNGTAPAIGDHLARL